MPGLVHSLKFTDHSKEKTVNREPFTLSKANGLTVNNHYRRLGFTLIELLIVIAILGVLSSFTVLTLIGHQKKARDSQRKNDLQQVKRALEAAKADCRGAAYYPFALVTGPPVDERVQYLSVYSKLRLVKYIAPLQLLDPKNDVANGYFYHYAQGPTATAAYVCPNSTGNFNYNGFEYFVLRAKLEITSDPDANKSYDACSATIATIGAANFDTSPALPAKDLGYYFVCSN
ncbi:MAG: prepilin-type N-terminal cleavage/methylation domain-containing protein [Patescibacteria group bacterium]